LNLESLMYLKFLGLMISVAICSFTLYLAIVRILHEKDIKGGATMAATSMWNFLFSLFIISMMMIK